LLSMDEFLSQWTPAQLQDTSMPAYCCHSCRQVPLE